MTSTTPLPAPEDKARSVEKMFDAISSRYDLVNRLMTLGMDISWRRQAVASLGLAPASLVVDLACGTGDLCDELTRQGLRTAGVDISAGMLAAAHTSQPLVRADILRLPMSDASVDGATCGFALRNVTDLKVLFDEMARVVRSGGRIALLEVDTPSSRVVALGHRIWFNHVVPLVGGLLSDRAAYQYLPASVVYLPAADEMHELLTAAGFVDLARKRFLGGAAQLILATRK